MLELINLVHKVKALLHFLSFFFFDHNLEYVQYQQKTLRQFYFGICETQHLLSDLEINYHFLQSSLEFIFSQQHLGFSLKEFIAPCPIDTS